VSGNENNGLRVILVGRTGLDAALRLDPEIELVRVRTPLEAVGELTWPVDGQSPTRAVVVLAPEVEWSLRQPANGDGHENIEDFVRGARTADPSVVVMGITRNGTPSAARGAELDGTIAADLSSDMLRRAIRQQPVDPEPHISEDEHPSTVHEPPAPRAVASSPPVAAPPSAPPVSLVDNAPPAAVEPRGGSEIHNEPAPRAVQAQTDDAGDLALVGLLVRGQDILSQAVELIRVRTGDDSVEFIPLGANGASAALQTDQPVAWEGTVFGHLRGAAVEEALLAVHAHWLAAWLRARDQQGQLRAAAFSDPLTGAYNRRYFERFLATAIEQARAARRYVTVFVFDIDDFKTYNDKYGHDAGDEILRETVRLMRSVIRPTDRVCRIGGDEFAVIYNEPQGPREEGSHHPKDVFNLAQRFQEQLRRHRFPKLSDCLPGTLTVSGGLATFPWDGTTPEHLLSRADQNALQSKRQGKNAITFGPSV
jgi:diguanylate cyclase (GGDEF)-like protein